MGIKAKTKQKCLETPMNLPSLSSGQPPGNADKMGISGVALCRLLYFGSIYFMNTGFGAGIMIPAFNI